MGKKACETDNKNHVACFKRQFNTINDFSLGKNARHHIEFIIPRKMSHYMTPYY